MILELEDISKIYPGVVALDEVNISFEEGEVHALMGENGAGKSTLIKVISGAITPSGGKIKINGHTYSRMTPKLSKDNGIAVIYQDVNLVPALTVAENIFIGNKQDKMFNLHHLKKLAKELLDEYEINLNPSTPVMALSPANQQLVEIAAAISNKAKILIMDEPTASLAESEVEILFKIIHKLQAKGITIIYISHRIDEVFEMSQRISILRDGHYICTLNTKDITRNELITYMVGRKLEQTHPDRANKPGEEVVLKAEHISGPGVEDVSLELHKGEILGVAGLVGAGRTEMAQILCGTHKATGGDIWVNGEHVKMRSPKDAIKRGIGIIPEDRKGDGCIMHNSVLFNTTLTCNDKYMKHGILSSKKRREVAQEYKDKLRIKVPNLKVNVGNLSGGNQQKVVVAKAMAADSDIIFFDEPTKGIDVGAKYEIYQLMNGMTAAGKSIIMISSDMEEILGVSDRIVVLHEGRVSGELTKEQFSQENVLTLASGMSLEQPAAQ